MKIHQGNFQIQKDITQLLEILISFSAFIFLSPILLIISSAIKHDSPGRLSFLIGASVKMGNQSMNLGFAQ
jgi:lipopolysaccharide/colanic/teichoic acid biosynthesis glycosyltransferase